MKKNDIVLKKHKETLQFHYQPARIRAYLRSMIEESERMKDAEESEKKKKEMIAVGYLYEDVLQIVEWAFAHIQPIDDTEKGQKS